ncbi:hypothetical protein SVAN01_09469 [Stagonosporopsis vannaccii]|nr:hypothetical protein SVAN01_09469 [Stagonosporopsis vannaccii]
MSTPQPAPVPQAPQIITTSPAGHTTTVQNPPSTQSNTLAQPTAATTAPAPDANTTTSSTLPAAITPTPGASTTPEELTYNEQLNNVDRLWKFKMALQVALIFASLIGIGCLAWAVDTGSKIVSGYDYGWDSRWPLPWGLITFSITFVYCFLCVLLFVTRKRPVHPGVRVTMDLLLWLGYIGTVLLTMVALFDVIHWGEGGQLSYSDGWSSRYGNYVLQRNNTWTWLQDNDYSSSVTYDRVCNGSSSSYYYYYDTPPFSNCAEMDAYVNRLWQEKPNRARVELTATVCQWLGLVLHFALFVWACVDCHRHRHSRVSSDAEKLAAGIVQNMVQNGAIVPPPGQAHMRGPAWQQAYQQLPSGANSFSAQGGWGPQGQGHGQYPLYTQQIGPHGMQQQQQHMPPLQMQMRGPRGPQRPISGEQPLPALPPRPAQTVAGPSNASAGEKGKAPAENVAASYYEPTR